jgi:transcriptional regulator with XRE-family HTH domain
VERLKSLLDKVADLSATGPLSVTERLNLLMQLVPDPQTGTLFTPARLARRSLVDRRVIGKIASAKVSSPTTDTLQKLADAFGVPVTYFIDPDIGAVLRHELQELLRVASVAQQMEELGVVSASFRPAVAEIDPPLESVEYRANRVAQQVSELAQNPANIHHLSTNLAAMESLLDVLARASRDQDLRTGQDSPP